MRLTFIVAMASATLMSAQVRSVAIRTTEPQVHPVAGLPVAGYVLGPGPVELHTIVLTSRTPRLGEAVAAPANARRLFLPPRQQYALIEQDSDAPVALWPLDRAAMSGTELGAIPLTGAVVHPDLVVFSPRGDSALLYSAAGNKIQVVSNLPNHPSVGKDISVLTAVDENLVAITDDASLVVFWTPDSASLSVSSKGSDWQSFALGVTPSAIAFVPNTHDLVVSDSAHHTILLLPDVSRGTASPRVLATVTADHLAFTKSGEWLLAADFVHDQMSTVEMKTGSVTRTQDVTQIDMVTTLRNGFTFLLSTNPALSLIQVVQSPEEAVAGGRSSRLATIDVVSNGK